jgi:hypothetical protein
MIQLRTKGRMTSSHSASCAAHRWAHMNWTQPCGTRAVRHLAMDEGQLSITSRVIITKRCVQTMPRPAPRRAGALGNDGDYTCVR